MTTNYTTSSQTLPEGATGCYDNQTSCDPPDPCGCPYGELAVSSTSATGAGQYTTKFDEQNPLNQELISAKLNYDNVEIITGSCVDDINYDTEQTKYWVKYTINLHNYINKETYYDFYNCVYNVQVTLHVNGEQQSIKEELVNLVEKIPEDVESYEFLTKTETITNVVVLDTDYCPSDLKLKVCFLSGKASTTDQVTLLKDTKKKIEYTCECCQEYTSFTSHCDESTEDSCFPCECRENLQNHRYLIKNNEEVSEIAYSVDLNEPCLVYRESFIEDPDVEIRKFDGYIAKAAGEGSTTFIQKIKSKSNFTPRTKPILTNFKSSKDDI